MLPDSPSANAYLPTDFVSGNKRSLLTAHLAANAYVSREIEIDFSSSPSSYLLIPELANFEDVVRRMHAVHTMRRWVKGFHERRRVEGASEEQAQEKEQDGATLEVRVEKV